jgi:methyl-accepting chemotaxis protein
MTTSRLTIGARLALGFGAVFVLMIGLTALAVSRVGRIDDTLDRINDVNSVKQRYAINFRGSVHDRSIALRDVVLATDEAAVAKQVELIRTLDANYQRSAGPLDKLFGEQNDLLADEKAALSAIKDSERKTVPLISQVIEMRKGGQLSEAQALLAQQAAPAFVEWLASVNRLIDLEEELNKSATAKARALSHSFLAWMVVLCAIAVACGSLGAWYISRSLLRQFGGQPDYAAGIVERIAAGELKVQIDTAADDQASLLHSMKGMRDSLVAIVGQVRAGTLTIANASTEIAAGNRDLANRTERQALAIEQTAASMEESTATVRQNVDNARQASVLAESASEVAVRGGTVVAQVVTTMASINESSRKVVDIIGVIDGIAFQTNILALNAAVEAARAGEQGRGFAVVATEVRNLAQRSAAAAKEIKELIGASVARVDAGARLVDEAGRTMEEIVSSVRRVTDIMAEIRSASEEQSRGIEHINSALGQMDEATRQNATLVQQASAAAASLEEEAERLAQVVSVFQIEGVEGAPVRPAAARPAQRRLAP